MKRLFGKSVFRQYFLSFFLVILIPVLIASILAYTFFANFIQTTEEKANHDVLNQLAQNSDKTFTTLQSNIVNLISSPTISKAVNAYEFDAYDMDRVYLIKELTELLNTLVSVQSIVDSAYIYDENNPFIVSNQGHFEKTSFLQKYNHYKELKPEDDLLSEIRMMDFVGPSTIERISWNSGEVLSSEQYVSVVTSFPLHAKTPHHYLVVNIKESELKKMIHVESDYKESAIITQSGRLLTHTDNLDESWGLPSEFPFLTHSTDSLTVAADGKPWLVSKTIVNGWHYVIVSDMEKLSQPAQKIRSLSMILCVFFLFVGLVISYLVSYKIYSPILNIQQIVHRWNQKQGTDSLKNEDSNELQLIENWSKSIMSQYQNVTQRMNEMKAIAMSHFLQKVLNGEFTDDLSIEIYCKELGFPVPMAGKKAVVCIHTGYFLENDRQISVTDRSFIAIEIKDRLEQTFRGGVWFAHSEENILTCIIQSDALPFMNVLQTDIALPITHLLKPYKDYFKGTVAVGDIVHRAGELSVSYRTALLALELKSITRETEMLAYQTGNEEIEYKDQGRFLSKEQAEKLTHLVNAGERQAAREFVQARLKEASDQHITHKQMLHMCTDIVTILMRELLRYKKGVDLELYSKLLRCIDFRDFTLFFDRYFDNQTTDELVSDDIFVQITAYIEIHYAESLTLEQFAEQFGMSLGHFSRSFKGACGDNFVDYLGKVRINKAKELLVESDMKLDHIAVRVGYSTPSYFIKLFKKHTGITPGNYRSVYRKNE
jgi:two-component system response regulator YesN